MNRAAVLSLCAVLSLGCSRPADRSDSGGAKKEQPSGPLVFLEDDYPAALAEAKAKGVPLFVDAWAPWCHTCLSLREYVLGDPSLWPLSKRFVWLSLDTEKDKNAAFLARYPVQFWPTLWVIDPAREAAVLSWPGSVTVPELVSMLDDAALAVRQGAAADEATAALFRGDRAAALGQPEAAVVAYRGALAEARPGWARRARLVDSLTTQLMRGKDFGGCAQLALAESPRLPAGTSTANVALTGLSCAMELPKDEPSRALSERAASEVLRVARDRAAPLLADDRSGLYEQLVAYRRDRGDGEGAREAAGEWAAFLEAQAAAAKDAPHRTVFDAHRLLAYTELGQFDKARAMITASEREFPADYNHPARLAKLDLDTRQYDDGLGAVDRALARAYGPRRIRLYSLKASLLAGKGDTAGARATLREGVALGEGMSLTGGYAKSLEAMKKKLAGL